MLRKAKKYGRSGSHIAELTSRVLYKPRYLVSRPFLTNFLSDRMSMQNFRIVDFGELGHY